MKIKNSVVHSTYALFILASVTSFSQVATDEQTTPNDDGGGKVFYLDRHTTDCGLNGIGAIKLVRPSSTQIAFQYHCRWTGNSNTIDRYTPANEDGSGDTNYLDRHAVDCAGKALQYLRLYRPSDNQIAYHYRCGERALANVTDYYTPGNDDGSGKSVYLDRHQVSCPDGDILTYIRLYRPTSSTIAYHYKCGETNPKQTEPDEDGNGNATFLDQHAVNCKSNGIGAVRLLRPSPTQIAFNYQCQFGSGDEDTGTDQNTPANDDGGGNAIYLDRHAIDCAGKALRYFRLNRPSANSIAYQYRCGKMPLVSVTDYRTPENDDGGGNSIYLDRHDVRCPAGDVLTYMRLYRPTGSTIGYHYKCGKYLTGKPLAYFLVQSAYERSEATLYGNYRQKMDALRARLNTKISNASDLSLDEYYEFGKLLADEIEDYYTGLTGSGSEFCLHLH
jgi:hypothetical protein